VKLLLAAKSNYFGKVIDSGQIVGLKDTVVGEADPRLMVHLAKLIGQSCHHSAGHTAVRHH